MEGRLVRWITLVQEGFLVLRNQRMGWCLLGVWLAVAMPAQAEKVTIVATVNDDVITSVDVDARRDFLMATANIPVTEENKQQITPRVLQALVDETLEMQEAKRQAIIISDTEVDQAIDALGERQNLPPGALKQKIVEEGLSLRTLENQVRAQLAWNKVVQRKLRRNVSISQDEVLRAQQAEEASPGVTEFHFAALLVPITPTSTEDDIKERIDAIQSALADGTSFGALAETYAGRTDVVFTPPVWAAEETLPPDIQHALAELEPKSVTPPLRTGNIIQFIQLLDRKVTKKSSPDTKVIIKQITLEIPPHPDQQERHQLTEAVEILRHNPGSCEDIRLPTTPVPAKVAFSRLTMGSLSPDQNSTLSRLGVGEVTEPLVSPETIRLVMLCERQEPGIDAPDLDVLRQKIFEEKLDLEAQKHLRNLQRDATIDVRDQ